MLDYLHRTSINLADVTLQAKALLAYRTSSLPSELMYLPLLFGPIKVAFTSTSAGHVDHDVECFQLNSFLQPLWLYLGTRDLLVR